ncbi:MAG: cadmium-translocating P-type ATPase [Alphaproteobacteria bacterium]|nr:cadmium-translocating P-type ATPase [Alphaproteobacteria bacterium]
MTDLPEDQLGYDTLAKPATDGAMALEVLVEGVHCAGCIQKIESSLNGQKDIRLARLNFSTRRLRIEWNGAAARADDFVRLVQKLGYGVHPFDPGTMQEGTKEEERFLLLCLGVAGFAMGNIMLVSVGLWSTTSQTMGMATHELMNYISAIIAVPAVIFSGRPFFRSAYKALKNGHANMDVPISLAILLATGMSLSETFRGGEHLYFDSAVMLMFFLLIGRYLDVRARSSARSAATDLLATLSGFALVVEGDKTRRIAIRDLSEGMKVRVAAGEKFPVDGAVIEGQSTVDTALITGETMPRELAQGAQVFAGTLNLSSPVLIEVAKAAEDSLLADIVRLMEKAGQGQAQYVRLADRAAQLYTPVVHSLAALAFLGWWIFGGIGWQASLMIAVTVLIITCPCALGLAVPVVQVLATGRLMKDGIMVKSGDALERLARIDTVFVDKTGTLTLGQPQLVETRGDNDTIKLAASLAAQSHHPLSKALAESYKGEHVKLEDVQDIPGKGLEARYNGKRVQLGSRAWCGDKNAPQDDRLELWLAAEGEKPVAFHFEDTLREDTALTLKYLQEKGLSFVLVTGDRKNVAEKIAKDVGIEIVHAEKTPPQKFEILEESKKAGHKVLMIGDGLNDAPVLAGADVSMAPGSAVDMAQSAADIVFMGGKFGSVLETWKIAVFSQKLVKENFALAILYNIIAIPLALAGMVTPMIAAIAMSGSSIIVILNSFRLKGKL